MSQGNSPIVEIEIDFKIYDHGSILIVQPITQAAHEWTEISIDPDAQWWGHGFVVEPRYIENLIDGITADGFTLEGI